MFGNRRRRAASNPPLNGSNANPAAMTAAASVFLKNQASNASLSSAAAAAALRSRPTTPTSVADVQTKRTLRRSGSTSSVGSSVNGSQRGGAPALERRGSSGSMTERTFRDPSPARGVPSAPDAPPVPAIPQNISKAHRRATSLEAPPMRIASPPPNQSSGRGSSLGPGSGSGSGPASPKRAAQRSSYLSSVAELTGADSRGSVNFSYPTNSRPQSPMSISSNSQKRLTSLSPSRNINNPRITSPNNQNLVYDPNTRSFLPAVEIHAIEQRIWDAANRPVKKKKRVPPGNATGSHFADGTVGGRPKGTAIDAMEAARHVQPVQQQVQPVAQRQVEQAPPPQKQVEKPVPAPAPALAPEPEVPAELPAQIPKKKKKKAVVASDSESDQASYVPNSSDNDSDFQSFNTRSGALLAKKPSIVREDREREELEDDTPTRLTKNLSINTASDRDISPSPLPRSMAGRGHGRGLAAASAALAQGNGHVRSESQPAPSLQTPSEGLNANGSVRGARVQSVSPGRNAHFAASPDNLVVKHQPPPRSISPRKSALKHSNSRTSSPVPGGSETSNISTPEEQQLSASRKKSVRVSFDESNVVVGQAATPVTTDSPIVQSPQVGKRPWYSIRGKKKEITLPDDDEEDEVMKPRPALPSFGSVRERKNRDFEDRPLVKPADLTEPVETRPDPQPAPSPLFTSPTGEIIENPLGQSMDHGVGAILSQESTRNAANISKSREPLPPQVTSVEGNGYNSDTDSSLVETESNTPTTVNTEPELAKQPIEIEQDETDKVAVVEPSNRDEDMPTPTQEKPLNGNVPEIAISHPTPTIDEVESKGGWPSIPGGWESSTSDSDVNETPRVSTDEVHEITPAAVGIAEPAPEVQVHGSPKTEAEHIQHSHPVILEETEESESDIYSDAAEEMTDTENEGFQSLNAVVESPIRSTIPGLAISTPPESPTSAAFKERAIKKSIVAKKTSEPDLNEGWEKAQEYWKGLSDDKKRQLELEAMQEAEEGSDTEVEIKPAPKPKKKKKVQQLVQQHAPADPSPERTYMIKPGSKAGPDGHSMRTSMRAVADPVDNQMRKSMRSQEPGLNSGSMRTSLRGKQEPKKKARPVSLPVKPTVQTTGLGHGRNLSSASAAAAQGAARRDMQPPPPTLRRKSSGDSDSSFKRAKPSTTMSMRRSLRGGESPSQERPQSPSSRFSIRSLSPTGSMIRRPFNSAPAQNPPAQTHMRMSMRGSQGPTPTLRGSAPARAKSPGGMKMPSFGRSSRPVKTSKPSRARSSRFADSSDEEDARPAFRSRFVDSSDDSDDEPVQRHTALGRTMRSSAPAPAPAPVSTPAPAAAVRGIPKRSGIEDGDSSDLPDSDDEKATASSPGLKLQKRQNGTAATHGAQGATLASGSLRRSGSGRGTISSPTQAQTADQVVIRPNQKRRGSFMSILRRKKDTSSKVRKSDAESPARRDTPLERSKSDLAALRNTGTGLGSPKLQKRNPLSRENSEQWPLSNTVSPNTVPKNEVTIPDHSNIAKDEDDRPFTSDGGEIANVNGNGRPNIGNRRFTATGLGEVDLKSVGVNGGVGEKKKKKFGRLRRMFRLDD